MTKPLGRVDWDISLRMEKDPKDTDKNRPDYKLTIPTEILELPVALYERIIPYSTPYSTVSVYRLRDVAVSP